MIPYELVWKNTLILQVLFTYVSTFSFAQDEPRPRFRFFDQPIDFWNAAGAKPRETDSQAKAMPGEWGHVVRRPDGTFAYQELPRPLVDVLEDPSGDRIRKYLEWRTTRAQKIMRAAQALKKYRDSVTPSRQSTSASTGSSGDVVTLSEAAPAQAHLAKVAINPPTATPFEILYFHRKNCPACDTQDRILEEWLKGHSQGKLETVEFGDKPELWRQFRLRGTPSLVIRDAASGKSIFFEGLTSKVALDEALIRSRAGESGKRAHIAKENDR